MERLEDKQVYDLGKLARIAISEEEKNALSQQLGQVLEFFAKLDQAPVLAKKENRDEDKRGRPEMLLREDEVKGFSQDNDALLVNAPVLQGRLYKTPPVI